tara:strand:- start:222 stop:776 length:555 start_codon:yes stop_codon:yes gene_type:complete
LEKRRAPSFFHFLKRLSFVKLIELYYKVYIRGVFVMRSLIIKVRNCIFYLFALSFLISFSYADSLPALPLDKLHQIDKIVGAGATAVKGKTVSVHYTGWLYDPKTKKGRGKKFDSSKDRGRPFQFGLGRGMVIKGWDLGVEGMKEGGYRTLLIPPEMGYGSRGAGGVIPPNAALIFDVELLTVK